MAFKKWNRSPSKKTPVRSWQPDEMKIIGWCLNKKIGVGISPDWKHDLHHWQIDIKIGNGKVHTDPNRYSDEDVHENVIKYYKYYYEKYRD